MAEEKAKQEPVEQKPKTRQPKQEKKEQKPAPVEYIHVDTFLQSAQPHFKLSNMQVQGFRAYMQGRQYQLSEQVFIDELKKYFKL